MEIMGISISAIDIILGIFLGFCGIWGWIRGLTTQLARLLTLFLGITAARQLGPQLAPVLQSNFQNLHPPTDLVASYILIFLAVCLGVSLLTWFLRDVLHELKLKKYDRIFGGVIGFLGGSIFATMLLSFFLMIFPQKISMVSQSQCVPWMCMILEQTQFVFPDLLKDALRRAMQQVRDASDGIPTSSSSGESLLPQESMKDLLGTINQSLKSGRDPSESLEKGLSQLFQKYKSPSNSLLKPEGSSASLIDKMGSAQLLFVSNTRYQQHFRKSLMGANGTEIATQNSFLDPWSELAIGAYQSGGEFRLRLVLFYPQGNAEDNLSRFSQNLKLSGPKNPKKRFSELLEIRQLVPEGSFLVSEFALTEPVNFAQWIEEADLPFLYFRD